MNGNPNDIFDLDVDEDINLYLSKKGISQCKMLNRCICNMVFVMVHLVFRMVIGYLYIWNKMMMMMMMTVLAAARQVPVDNNFTDILPPFILQSTAEWEEKIEGCGSCL